MELVNLNKVLTDLSGKPIKENAKDNSDATVKHVLSVVVAAGFEKATPAQSVKLYKLAMDLYESSETLEVDAGMVDLLNRSWEANLPQYPPVIRGQVLLLCGLEKE